jgi:hypothetical protein
MVDIQKLPRLTELSSLPATEVVALYIFAYFIAMPSQLNFFLQGQNNKIQGQAFARLSVDKNGSIHENLSNYSGLVHFNLAFDYRAVERVLERAQTKQGQTVSDMEQLLSDALFVQITPQIYQQVFLQSHNLTWMKKVALAGLEDIATEHQLDIYLLYQKLMMPIVAMTTQKRTH